MGLALDRFRKWLPLVLILLIAGCATPKRAIYLDPGLNPSSISKITLLPVLDSRIEKKTDVNIPLHILEAGMRILNMKRYKVILSDNMGGVEQITENDLKSEDSEWIKQLGPTEARWVMALVLVDYRTKLIFLSLEGYAEVAGFLYDKENGRIVWRDKGIGKSTSPSGLLGVAAGIVYENRLCKLAIYLAMDNLLASIPIRSK
ncbi:MAG: hypothetical protein ABSH06_29945 [Thermodesulfobacteriota bacterium]